MELCPYCASENIFYSKKRAVYFCEDCSRSFSAPAESDNYRIFISYGHDKNIRVVKEIKAFLASHGYDVWIDSSEISAGRDWRERITSGLIGSNGVISFLSKHSVRDPGVCLDELRIASRIKRAYIKTVLLEDRGEVVPPSFVSRTQWVDMSDWGDVIDTELWDGYFNGKMAELLKALKSKDATEYGAEIDWLISKLKIAKSSAKEQHLIGKTFVGRGWLTKRIDEWMQDSEHGMFMLYGVPGSGKSAFAVNLIQYHPSVVGSVIFEWDHDELCNTNSVIRRIAFELAVNINDYRKLLIEILSDKNEGDSIEHLNGASLLDKLVLHPLQCCISGERDTALMVFDGLDETSDEIAELLCRKASAFPSWLKVLFTSRYDPSRESYFDGSCVISLNNTLKENTADIREYLSYRLGLDINGQSACRLSEKTEGSFMYASAFCDAVEAGNMSLDDEETLPRGMDNFYRVFFKRMFPTRESFSAAKPLLELLATENDIPEAVICEVMGSTLDELRELRFGLKSLMMSTESHCGSNVIRKFKAMRLVHKSVADWLCSEELANEFYIDRKKGYLLLSRFAEDIAFKYEDVQFTLVESTIVRTLASGNDFYLNDYGKKLLRQYKSDPVFMKKLLCKELKQYAEGQYVKWLIRGQSFDKAKAFLLSTFNRDDAEKRFSRENYTEYYCFYDSWQWIGEFPEGYPLSELIEKLKEIIDYPRQLVVSRFATRSFQILYLLFSMIADRHNLYEAFFYLVRVFPFAGFFMSRASDDSETRDGWDKYYIAKDANACIKKLQRAGVDIPEDVLASCEKMKLTYHFHEGRPEGGIFDYAPEPSIFSYGILGAEELFCDICRYDADSIQNESERERLRALKRTYNTTSMRFYLVNGTDEDIEYIASCILHEADALLACEMALSDINTLVSSSEKSDEFYLRMKRRIKFIEKLKAVNTD